MPTLFLGVVDVAYSDPGAKGAATTGEVAEILESQYHIMRTFVELYEDKISELLANEVAGEIESIAQGKPVTHLMLDVSTGRIGELFRDYIDAREWKQVSGQAIAAADAGMSHRKKKPTANENKSRVEFVDTGLYQASVRAWIES